MPDLQSIVRNHHDHVRRLAARLIRDSDEAEDVAQEVFILVARDLPRLRNPLALRRWLACVVHNRAMTHLRQRRRQRALFAAACDHETLADPAPATDVRAQAAMLAPIVASVPERFRLPWTLHVVEGETLDAVALKCLCSVATVKRRIAAARTHLDRALA